MTGYAVFLRGVNVGGVNIKMADAVTALTDAGFTAVRTILASGNVLLESSASAAVVRRKAEAALRERFGYQAWVLAYDIDTVRAVVDAYPFAPEVDGHQSYVTFVADPAVLDELCGLADTAGAEEKIGRGEGVVYWQVPKGATLTSTIGKTMGKPKYKSATTTRNLRTLSKVVRSADRGGG
ncbi:DUF1697 domain-containing protein [Mycobacterium sherrisii]|uniref:Pyridoxamine 5-phosphate oxidase n=1 Tax=Mycobacterium sherrisii TaxID=243061 RepID=A0A1E3SRR6_9MYCO|nr:DUF1697 domain-containing protein [Mycobacterium sherrisii]MCV7030483.1 DUF1697 domain-containing protein [Mycobacterium sherrisii]MEC4762231.1 DUF1697 domain-containing protein [Mycobacterium sherrisii]ODR04799.1 pyridoxamine 5-phosphate oxidase [Mycobacterium sherrisii]ORW81460.1 pyridoxamine 5-phosphate oxidase [Mycobacterium sherrisii]